MQKKLKTIDFVFLCIMYFGFSFHWTIMLYNILPTRVLDFASELNKGTYLAIVTTSGALIALITCPIMGVISDRTLSLFGRRRPYLLIGIVLNSFFLLFFIYTNKYILFLISFLFIQFLMNTAGTPYSALIPDKVSPEQRGEASGIMGFMDVFARICGSFTGGIMMGHKEIPKFLVSHSPYFLRPLAEKYIGDNPIVPTVLLIILIINILMIITVLRIKEEPLTVRQPLKENFLKEAFWFDIKGNISFAYLILSRIFNNLGVYTIVCFLLYYIKDYLVVGDIQEANKKMGILMGVVAITTLPSALLTGYLVDKYKKRKIFLYISCAIMILISFTFIIIRDFSQALLVGAVFGFAFGAFCTADWTLALDLLPEEEKAGKNLGIWNYAGVGPQVIAPAIGGILLDKFNLIKYNLGYQAVFIAVIIYIILGTLILIKVKERKF